MTIELLEPGMGKVMGSIPNVNFVDGMNQAPVEESIGEMLSKLGNGSSTLAEQNDKISFDNDNSSMGKQKQGKQNPVLSPASKEEKKREKEKQKENEKGKDKPKLPPNSGLGPTPPTAPLLSTTKPTTRQSPKKRNATQSPEGAPLHSNLRINPTTGVPYTTEAERRAIKEILDKRHKRPLEEEDKEEEMVPKKKKSPLRRTSRDLIAKKKTLGGPQTGDPEKGPNLHRRARPHRRKCPPSKGSSTVWGITTQMPRARLSTNMAEGSSGMRRNRQ